MKNHSMEGLRAKAPRTTCTVACGATTGAQVVRGITVIVESMAITCLYDAGTKQYLWIANGQFVHEDDVKAFLDEGRPPAIPEAINISDELAKFDSYLKGLPALAQTEGHEQLLGLSRQWSEQYSAPGGYTQLLEATERTIKQGHGPVPLHVLFDKRDKAEAALLDIADQFTAEVARADHATA